MGGGRRYLPTLVPKSNADRSAPGALSAECRFTRLSAPGWDQVAAPLLSALPAARPPSHTRGGAGAGARQPSRGGGGEGEREGEGAALTRRLPRSDLRVASSDAGIAWQPCRDWRPMWSAPCPHSTVGETEAQKVSGYSGIAKHSELHRLTLGWWVPGELETQVPLQAPTCSLPPLLLLCPAPAEQHGSSLGSGPIHPRTPEDPFLPAPEAVPCC